MSKKVFCILCLIAGLILLPCLVTNSLNGKNQNTLIKQEPVDILVQFTDKSGITQFNSSKPDWVISTEPVIENYQIYKISVYSGGIDIQAAMNYLRQLPYIGIVQTDKKIEYRSIVVPNDTLLPNQWEWDSMQLYDAWGITTGGVTVQNDTIVIAVIDDGMDKTHEDFSGNIWYNRFEIPGDSIDNDSNGYIDDFAGWNTYRDDDSIFDPIEKARHGIPMAGFIGAAGNNVTGIAGMNWNVKLMIVVGGPAESNALKAFGYIIAQKKRYLETNGAGGAYVVATNGSWGVDRKFPQEAPLWCAIYDTLGKYGIINIAATSNSNINVDIEGDLPTTCPSDFMIGVTNLTKENQEYTSAAYGKTHIDLGAPGHNTFTTASTADFSGRLYKNIGGTSAAAPHVTGIPGLLYAAACDSFITLSKEQPDSAAWWIRYFILHGVDIYPGLSEQVGTSGRANAYKPLLLMEQWCDGTLIVGMDIPDYESESKMVLYPNPGKDYFEISGIKAGSIVKVFDTKGILIVQVPASQDGLFHMQLPDIAQGLYFVKVYHHKGAIKGNFKWIAAE